MKYPLSSIIPPLASHSNTSENLKIVEALNTSSMCEINSKYQPPKDYKFELSTHTLVERDPQCYKPGQIFKLSSWKLKCKVELYG